MKTELIGFPSKMARLAQFAQAAGVNISDPNSHFVSGDVEGALAELAEALLAANGPPIDRALTGAAWSQGPIPDFAIVQSTTQRDALAASLTLTLPAAPTPGNLLVLWHVTRAAATPTGPTSDWIAHPDGVASASGFGEFSAMFYRVVQSGDGASVVSNNSGGAQSAAILVEIAGAGLVQDSVEVNDQSGSAMSASVTTTGAAVIVGGGIIDVDDTGSETVAPTSPTVEIAELYSNTSPLHHPAAWLGYKTVAIAGAVAVEAVISAARNWGMQALAFATAPRPWTVPEPNVNDGDDATYEELTGTPVVMVDLGAGYQVTSMRLLIGCATAGAKTYVIRGSVDISFDPDLTATLATLNFTATGSYTADEVLASWAAGVPYRYFELSGDDETRRIFSWELLQEPFSIELALDDLTDVDTTGKTADDVLFWDATAGLWKASAPPAITIEDEGTPLATAADTLDFTGAGVTASGTGASKTITIPGTPVGTAGGDLSGTYPNPSVVDDSHSHTAATLPATGAVGPILITDTPAGSPLVFADLLQTEAGDDLIYADV